MDSFSVNSKKSFHIRSNSLPSKPHPVVHEVSEHLCRLKASEEATSHPLLCAKNLMVSKIYMIALISCFFCHSPIALLNNKSVDDLLEGSLKILDVCALAKDVLSQMKESAHELESALRRRKDGMVDIQKYLNSRKMMKKAIHKTLKGMEKTSSQKSDESSEIVRLLKEVETVTCNSIESLLSFVAGPKLPSKMSKWSLVSMLMQPKRVACKDDSTDANEVEMVDVALNSITNRKSDIFAQDEDVQNSLRKLELCIDDIEEDLESLHRHLIKNRVSFLNILNH